MLVTVTVVEALVVAAFASVNAAGIPAPVTVWPMTRPVVLATVTEVEAAVVAPPVSATGAATELMVVPKAMPGPATGMPGIKPVTLGSWTAVDEAVVVALLRKRPPAPKVRAEPVAVAALLSTKVVPLVMEATVAPAGMPAPVTAMPTERAAVLATVTLVEESVVAPEVSAIELGETWVWLPVRERLSEVRPPPLIVRRLVTVRSARRFSAEFVAVAAELRVMKPLAVRVCAEAVAVAAALSTKDVPLVMEATVAPAGMFGPEIGWPTTRPVVLATVTVVEALVVEAAVSCSGLATAVTVVPAEMPVPETPMPTRTPVVPPAVRVLVAAEVVAGWFSVTTKPLIAVMTESAAIPVPLIGMPTTRPVASATVTAAEPATVVAFARKMPGEETAVEAAVVEAEATLKAPELKT